MALQLKKIATNIPEDLLAEAVHLTGWNQTRTLVEGLKELIERRKREALLALQGKIVMRLSTHRTRERRKV
ncbi:MAG: type II toxin-antitoxin system VapB family antitoxin [Deltaproteobacteria bacterium]|nr:type II toxin-antitoxin system VapB family antitoxin [Deltaproteobacteria bacterium]